MPYNHRRPRPGKLGTQLLVVGSGQIGGTGMLGSTTPLTVNDTTIFHLPSPPRRARFSRFCASQVTVGADADGTILARVMKYDGVANSAAAISDDIDLEAATTRELQVAGILSTQTEAGITFDPADGDTLCVNVVNNSAAINTQPAGLVFTVEFELLD